MSKITWFHFSDIHFKATDDFDRRQVLNSLWLDIKKVINDGILPTFIFITGDLAYSGMEKEYDRLEKEFLMPLIELTAIERNRIYFVPGNHDFNRSYLKNLNPQRIFELDNREKVNNFLCDEQTLKMYLTPFEQYSSFVKRFTQANYFHKEAAYAYCDNIEISGRKFSIIGLNSSWACNYNQDGRDQGRLIIGEYQILSVLKNVSPDSITITLQHHPFNWLNDFDQTTVYHQLINSSWFIHHGHVHRASEINNATSSSSKAFIFGVAACYDRRLSNDHYTNGYSINTLDLQSLTVSLKLRKYVDAPTPHWTANEDIIGENTNGEIKFPLSSKIQTNNEEQKKSSKYYSSLEEIYRDSPIVAGKLPEVFTQLFPRYNNPKGLASERFEEVICSLKPFEIPGFTASTFNQFAIAILFSDLIIKEIKKTYINKLHSIDNSISSVKELLSSIFKTDDDKILIDRLSFCWRTLSKDWKKPPYDLIKEINIENEKTLILVSFLGLVILLFTEEQLSFKLLPIDQTSLSKHELEEILLSTKIRITSNSIIELTNKVNNNNQFVFISKLRFYLESRLEQLADIFASNNLAFLFQSIRLKLIQPSNEISEHRFSVDTNKVIELLMGKELYGDNSEDIWFREVFQNAIDACCSRSLIDKTHKNNSIEINYSLAGKKFIIRDTGIGMNLNHINRFFSKVGRSIWRSDELISLFDGENSGRMSIGKFGIGFLSVFQIAEHITIKTRFCLENEGHLLNIGDVQEPFYIEELANIPIGTELIIYFKKNYEPLFDKITTNCLSYKPKEINILGLSKMADSVEEALDNLIAMEPRNDSINWMKSQFYLSDLEAHLYVAIPIPSKKHEKLQKEFPYDSKIKITNGGITIYERNEDWLGADNHKRDNPSSGIYGIRAILDFNQGAAPVTASRNGIRLSDISANQIIEYFHKAAVEVWIRSAENTFKQSKNATNLTKHLLYFLGESAKEVKAYYSSYRWNDNKILINGAKNLLLEYGFFEVLKGQDLSEKLVESVANLNGNTSIVLTTRDNLKLSLFQLYCTQVSNLYVIALDRARDIHLLEDCQFGWSKISTDEEMWKAIKIEEDKSLKLHNIIPAEVALVSTNYFSSNDDLLIVLPVNRAKGHDIVGNRASAAIPARILANKDHTIWKSIELKLNSKEIKEEHIEDVIKLLFHNVDEKAKTRREALFKSTVQKILKLCDLPGNTIARM